MQRDEWRRMQQEAAATQPQSESQKTALTTIGLLTEILEQLFQLNEQMREKRK